MTKEHSLSTTWLLVIALWHLGLVCASLSTPKSCDICHFASSNATRASGSSSDDDKIPTPLLIVAAFVLVCIAAAYAAYAVGMCGSSTSKVGVRALGAKYTRVPNKDTKQRAYEFNL